MSVAAHAVAPVGPAGHTSTELSSALPPAATQRSRELLRTPATATLAVAELPLPAAAVDRPALSGSQRPAPAEEAAVLAAAPAPAPAARVEPVVRHDDDDALEEPEWLRADDPQDDRPVNGSAEARHLPVREPPPPWDDDRPESSPMQRAPSLPQATVFAASRGAQASTPANTVQTALATSPRSAPAHVEQPVTTLWLNLLQPMFASGRLNGFVRELAWQSECLACEGADQAAATVPASAARLAAGELRVTLRVARESLRQTQLRDRLQAALTEQLGCSVTIEVTPGAVVDSAALRDAAARGKRQADAEVLVHNHPLVKSLLAALPGARVLPGSIRPTGTPS
jgi:DNA polymerase-3 subunit gamma/tau